MLRLLIARHRLPHGRATTKDANMIQVAKSAIAEPGTARRAAACRSAVAMAALVAMLAALCFVTPAQAQEAVALSGELFVAGRTAIDPPAREPKNSHAYFTVEGDAARRMFTSMRSKEEKDLCRGEGWKLKQRRIGTRKALLDPDVRANARRKGYQRISRRRPALLPTGANRISSPEPGCSPRLVVPHPH
jgi:hypothetical protein